MEKINNKSEKKKLNRNAFEAAVSLLNYSDRTEAQIRKKLREKNYEEEEVENAVLLLYECGYINDIRYAENYVTECVESCKGPYIVRKRLEERGVDAEIGNELMEKYYNREAELEICRKKAEKLLNISDEADEYEEFQLDRKTFEKTARKLASCGFTSSCILDTLKNIR